MPRGEGVGEVIKGREKERKEIRTVREGSQSFLFPLTQDASRLWLVLPTRPT